MSELSVAGAFPDLRSLVEAPVGREAAGLWEDTLQSEGVRVYDERNRFGPLKLESISSQYSDAVTKRGDAASGETGFQVRTKSERGFSYFNVNVGPSSISLSLRRLVAGAKGQETVIDTTELSELTPAQAGQLLPSVEASLRIALCGKPINGQPARSQESIRQRLRPDEPPSQVAQIEAVLADEYSKLEQSRKSKDGLSPQEKQEALDLLAKYEDKYRAHQKLEAELGPLMRVAQQIKLIARGLEPNISSAQLTRQPEQTPVVSTDLSASSRLRDEPAVPSPPESKVPNKGSFWRNWLRPQTRDEKSPPRPPSAPVSIGRPAKRPDAPPPRLPNPLGSSSW